MRLKRHPERGVAKIVALYDKGNAVHQLEGVQLGEDGGIEEILSDRGRGVPCIERISICIVWGPGADESTLPGKLRDVTYGNHSACTICLDQPPDVVFLPCGHLTACGKCAASLSKCPICRGAIKTKISSQILKGIEICDLVS